MGKRKDRQIEDKIRKLLTNRHDAQSFLQEDAAQLAQELNTYYQEIHYQNDELKRVTEELAASARRSGPVLSFFNPNKKTKQP